MRNEFGEIKNSGHKINVVDTKNHFNEERNSIISYEEDKLHLHETIFSKFINTTTKVTYFNAVMSENDYNMQSNSSMSTISQEIRYFNRIEDLEIIFTDNISLNNEGMDAIKNYMRTGNIKIMGNTIIPYVGDKFIFKYMGKSWLFIINSVNKESLEYNSAFNCEINVDNSGDNFNYDEWIKTIKIQSTYTFKAEHIGTEYKTILSKEDVNTIDTIKELYNSISNTYYDYFFNNITSIYVLENICRENQVNLQTLNRKVNETSIYSDRVYYDNFLQYFIKSHRIFLQPYGKTTIPTTMAGFESSEYSKTIFRALEIKDTSLLKYTSLQAELVNKCNSFIPTSLYGMNYVIHANYHTENNDSLLPDNFFDRIINYNFHKRVDFDKAIYVSNTDILIEIIALFLAKTDKNDEQIKINEIIKRLKYLSINKKYNLTIDEIYPQYIYYLFPMIGYIIINILNIEFNKNNKKF